MKVLKRYLITLAICLAGVGMIVWSKDIASQTSLEAIFHILSDAFFVIGVITAGLGLLVLASNEGTFDALSYGVGRFFDFFRKKKRMQYETFYDYRTAHAEKKARFGFLLICGLGITAIAVIMYLLYLQF